jgi:hypothetical protein
MSAGWVAAGVRARAMARRRLGLAAVRRLAAAPSLDVARSQLAGTAYAAVASAPSELAAAQRAVAASTLWQLRVLAGWLPASGTTLARVAAAAFERENLVEHLRRLTGAAEVPLPFELGSLTTAWNRVRVTTTADAAIEEIAASPWGIVTPGDLTVVRDELTAAWLGRVAAVAPVARPWAQAAAVLLVARCQVLEGRPLAAAAASRLDGLLGPDWPTAHSLDELRAALDPAARSAVVGVTGPDRLWPAEAGLWSRLADGGARLLRRPGAGPEHVTGALAVLAADALRVSAALAAAAAGGGAELTEAFDGVA